MNWRLGREDVQFARAAEARPVRGQGVARWRGCLSNLENVQGDERDHMIISTTYGPDPSDALQAIRPAGAGWWRPPPQVLVTRARQEVHLVTSIPPGVYRGVPPVPVGQTAGRRLVVVFLPGLMPRS